MTQDSLKPSANQLPNNAEPHSSFQSVIYTGRGNPYSLTEIPMKPLITPKEIHQGAKWELRLRLTDETKHIYQHLKQSLQVQHGKTYSDPKFFEVLMKEVSTILRITP